MTVTINKQQAIDYLNKAIIDKQDFVYSTPLGTAYCRYAHEDEPGCLVGNVFYAAGCSMEDLEAFDEIGDVMEVHYQSNLIKMSNDAARLLQRVQLLQDNGDSWGEAVKQAIKEDLELEKNGQL